MQIQKINNLPTTQKQIFNSQKPNYISKTNNNQSDTVSFTGTKAKKALEIPKTIIEPETKELLKKAHDLVTTEMIKWNNDRITAKMVGGWTVSVRKPTKQRAGYNDLVLIKTKGSGKERNKTTVKYFYNDWDKSIAKGEYSKDKRNIEKTNYSKGESFKTPYEIQTLNVEVQGILNAVLKSKP